MRGFHRALLLLPIYAAVLCAMVFGKEHFFPNRCLPSRFVMVLPHSPVCFCWRVPFASGRPPSTGALLGIPTDHWGAGLTPRPPPRVGCRTATPCLFTPPAGAGAPHRRPPRFGVSLAVGAPGAAGVGWTGEHVSGSLTSGWCLLLRGVAPDDECLDSNAATLPLLCFAPVPIFARDLFGRGPELVVTTVLLRWVRSWGGDVDRHVGTPHLRLCCCCPHTCPLARGAGWLCATLSVVRDGVVLWVNTVDKRRDPLYDLAAVATRRRRGYGGRSQQNGRGARAVSPSLPTIPVHWSHAGSAVRFIVLVGWPTHEPRPHRQAKSPRRPTPPLPSHELGDGQVWDAG